MSNNREPKFISLSVLVELKASHSLAGFEIAHFHLWKIAAKFLQTLPLRSDRVIDLVFLQSELERILAPLQNQYLNQQLALSPTTENIAQWVWARISEKLPDCHLHELEASLCDLEGRPSGSAKIWS